MRLLPEIRNYMDNYHVKSGVYHYYRAEFRQALEFLRKALRDEPKLDGEERQTARRYLTLSHLGQAQKLEAKEDFEGSLEELRRAAEASPRFPDVRFRMGRLQERLGRLDPAVNDYREAIRLQGGYLDAHIALAFCLLSAERDEEAASAFDGALELKLEQTRAPARHGRSLLAAGNREAASESFHQAFRTAVRLSDEYLSKAREWIRQEDYEQARIEIDRALGLSPNYPDLHNLRGVVLCELDRPDDGAAAFRRALELRPDDLAPKLNLAFAQLRAGRYREAEEELESVLERCPGHAAARARLAELRTGRGHERSGATTRSSLR